MENNRHSRALVFRRTVVARALAVAFGAVALAGSINTTAFAQSNATGNIFGRVEGSAGATVLIENMGTGFKRTLTIDATGRFVATSLPTGTYKASLIRNGAVANAQDGIEVLLGQGAEVTFGAKALQTVQVTGQRTRIDVSNTNNGSTFTAKELEAIPAVRNVDNIIQLAPNTTRADPSYAGGASFGGGAPSENSYYINGFPVTNALTQLGGSQLPFGAIGQAQILTGGFGAEFGRSVGGVVNIATKSGTNTWEAGVQVSVKPSALRSKQLDLYFPTTGDPQNASTDGTLRLRRSENSASETSTSAYLSGPLVQDKLLMFLAFEQINANNDYVAGLRTSTTTATNGWGEDRAKTTRYLGKFDWNLTNDHRLEWTTIGDRPTLDQSFSGYDYATNARNGVVTSGGHFQNVDNTTAQGADVNIIKYTGELTPDLTLTGLYGLSKSPHISEYMGYSPSIPGVTFGSPTARAPGVTYPVLNPISGQYVNGPGAADEVKGFRLDLEYRLNKHTIRGGVDDNKLSSADAGQILSGGKLYSYYIASAKNTNNPNFKPTLASRGINLKDPAYGPLANQGYYGRELIFSSITSAFSNQTAQYIEDKYQATKDLLLTAGLRRETYENLNGDGQAFLTNSQLNPRFAAAWDVNGDSSLKVFGSAGRYSLQIPTHIAVRGASRSTYTRSYFTYTGVDASGAPIGRIDVTEPRSSNNEYGQAKDYKSVAALDMKPTNQDELTIGFEKALSPSYNGGVKMTYRNLKSTIDDFCDPRPFDAWLARNPGVDATNWGGFGCASINPGIANTFLMDFNDRNPDVTKRGNHTTVALSAADIGLPSAERKYFALDFFLEHPLRNSWYGKINYTYSTSKGNTEGQTLSDTTTAQADVAATQTWDHPELSEGAYGYLPNDRRHQIKAFGFVQLNPEWQFGGNILLASGRPKNCVGYYAGTSPTQGDVDYGSSYFYCNGVATPRGSQGNLPWDKRLDLNVVYKPASVKGLAVKADVTNVFNAQTPQKVDESYNNNVDNAISATYDRIISLTPPRSVRLSVSYDYKF